MQASGMKRYVSGFLSSLYPALISFIPCSSFSQTYNFRQYSVDDGLPFIQVYTIFQDSKGYLWSGGYGGLSRFDGKNFVNYGPKNGLADHFVTSITEKKNGNLLAGTTDGLSEFDGKKFTSYTIKDKLPSNNITALAIGNHGCIWVGTEKGAALDEGSGFRAYTVADGLPDNKINCIFRDNKGTIWFGTARGVSAYSEEKKIFSNFTVKDGLSNNSVNSISQDNDGNIWFATDNGLSCCNPADKETDGKKFKNYFVNNGLPVNKLKSVVCDKRNELWIATGRGLCRFNGKRFFTYNINNDVNSNLVGSLFIDFEENLWIGTYSGLFRYRGDAFASFTQKDGLANTFVSPICAAKGGGLWLGTIGGGIFRYWKEKFVNYTIADGLSGNSINACMLDRDSNLWIGTDKGLSKLVVNNDRVTFENYSVKNLLGSDSVTAIIQDKAGVIWLGGRKGVLYFDPAKGKADENNFRKIILKRDDEDEDFYVYLVFQDSRGIIWLGSFLGGLYWHDAVNSGPGNNIGHDFSRENPRFKSRSVLGIYEDKSSRLYFGTMDGVFRYDPKKKRTGAENFISFTEKDGLSSDLVYSMISDGSGKTLWIGTNQGLNQIDISEFERAGKKVIEPYGKEEGFLGVECNTGALREKDGTIWFGTVNGLIKYNPKEFLRNNSETKTSITGFRIFYNDTLLYDKTELPWYDNNISFDFIGICLTNPSKVRYSYILDGLDREWSPETKNTTAKFSNIPPGTYTFRLKSRNNEGRWNTVPVSFTFTVLTPWWKTWWFRILLMAVIVSGIYFAIQFRIRQIEITEHNKVRLANNELKALRAQMDPHFIFNALNSIQHFVMNSDEQGASKYLNKFAKLIRSILNNTEKASVSFKDEVESLCLYIELEMLRFENKFNYNIKIDEHLDLDFYEVPTLLLQPYVENAIIHGLIPRKEPGHLQIDIQIENNFIVCTITDNGIGRKKSAEMKTDSVKKAHQSFGMKITRDRLELLNSVRNSSLSVNITDLTGPEGQATGTKVEIYIPVI